MAQRLSLDERARVEAMITAGVSVAEAARRLERDPSTIHRELALNRDGAYDAEACGCRKLCRGWSGGISVLVDESVTAGRFHDLEVSVWLV